MTKPYCTHMHPRNAGWGQDRETGLWVAKCGLPSRLVWEASQKSCEEVSSDPTSPDMIDVDGKENEMKEIEMSEHEHPAFEADNCPACGTSADLTHNPPLISEDEIKAATEATQAEINERLDGFEHSLAYRIRTLRESLGLSRKQVQDATGLGASVVWRAEQEGKVVEDRIKIWDMLTACQESGHFPAKERKSRKANDMTAEAGKRWMEKTWELRGVIDQAHELAVAKRQLAAEAKRSTKTWDELITLLEPHITEH